jgi:hypothetical protein
MVLAGASWLGYLRFRSEGNLILTRLRTSVSLKFKNVGSTYDQRRIDNDCLFGGVVCLECLGATEVRIQDVNEWFLRGGSAPCPQIFGNA